MGTQVHEKGVLPGYYSMRDLNEDSTSSNWPLFYGDRAVANGQYCNGFTSRSVVDACSGYNKDAVKQKMLEHEAIFKNQVSELHRLYRIQRDMMEEVKKKEVNKNRMSLEPSSSSSILGSQVPYEDAQKWHVTGFPLTNSGYARPCTSSTEMGNSLLSCTQGSDVQSARVQLQNGCSSKNCEAFEARPSKVRKKLFDLQFSADQYIDTEEGKQLQDSKESIFPSYPASGNFTIARESSMKSFLGGGEKPDSQKDASMSHLRLRSVNGLADLNEPPQLEEATIPPPVDFLGHCASYKEPETRNVTAKPNPGFLAPPEMMWNTNHGTSNGPPSSPFMESKGKERDWLSYKYEAGHTKSSVGRLPQCLEQNKLLTPFHPVEARLGKAHQNPGIHQAHNTRDDLWRARAGCGLETLDKSRENSNCSRLEPGATSLLPHPHHLGNSSEISNSWSCSVSNCGGRPTSSLTQKLTSFHTSASLNSSTDVSRNSHPYSHSHETIGDKWHANGSSIVNPGGLGSELPVQNGFYHGSSSGLREPTVRFPSVFFNTPNDNKGYNVLSGCSTNHQGKFLVGSNLTGSKSAKDFDLNVADDVTTKQDEEFVDDKRKLEDSVAKFPWLKSKPVQKNEGKVPNSDSEFIRSSSTPFCKGDMSKNLNEILIQNAASTLSDIGAKEVSGTQNVRKILGVPIENRCASKNESPVSNSATIPSLPEGENIRNDKKNIVIDINVAFDASIAESEDQAARELHAADSMDSKATGIRNHFDLNSCITEDEDPLGPCVVSNNVKARTVLEIDLEAPVVLDNEGDNVPEEDEHKQHEASLQLPKHKVEQAQDEVARIAAESIVAISSVVDGTRLDPSEDPLTESLRWFVNAVSSGINGVEGKSSKEIVSKNGAPNDNSSSEEIDYFEAMTLQLTETKEEDYMPKPFVPEFQNVEDSAVTSVSNRTRKGPGRRGRQRRDFQRDILPGLTSLSRHEVTEDLQTFGGLMRATGHPWTSGLTRRNGTRNGGGRGRRRRAAAIIDSEPALVSTPPTTSLMHQHNTIESSLEDRSLTGWGKTTRRPRRQRCPATGNLSAIPLS
nr:uncharacterized protein LOC109166260 [Ipomoea trifida]